MKSTLIRAVMCVTVTGAAPALLSNPALPSGSVQSSGKVLDVATWGGPYEAAQREALFAPFTEATGIRIDTRPYQGGLDVLDEQRPPDLVDMLEEDALTACEQDRLTPLAADTVDAIDDFTEQSIAPCSVAHLTFSTVLAYDERAFTGEKPRRIADLFNVKRFPGKRALQRQPAALFEWAMMAEGVPSSQVYDLLSTERGMRLVKRRLESLRGHIIWWKHPAEAVALLESGEAVMASGYNGRFFDAWMVGTPLNMIWDGQIIDRSVWAIPAAVDSSDAARAFIRFATRPERQAHVARQIPYGPTRLSAFRYIGLHEDTGIVMSDHLPTATHHLDNALYRDTRWYARTEEFRRKHFEAWLSR